MTIEQLLAAIARDERWTVEPSQGIPVLPARHRLPEELRTFYRSCGGVHPADGIGVVSPARLVQANPVILDQALEDDPSANWYIVAESGVEGTAERVVIDLGEQSRGHCYEAFWDRYGVAGSMPIVAASFSDFLSRLIGNDGNAFWTGPAFAALGDAYDGLNVG